MCVFIVFKSGFLLSFRQKGQTAITICIQKNLNTQQYATNENSFPRDHLTDSFKTKYYFYYY